MEERRRRKERKAPETAQHKLLVKILLSPGKKKCSLNQIQSEKDDTQKDG